jgi:hypothetical protein
MEQISKRNVKEDVFICHRINKEKKPAPLNLALIVYILYMTYSHAVIWLPTRKLC